MKQTLEIAIDRQPTQAKLENLGVSNWAIWSKGVSTFPWTYDEQEICYFLEGDVVVTPAGGEPMQMGKGDLVTFPAGMSCTWEIRQTVKKHYQFGE